MDQIVSSNISILWPYQKIILTTSNDVAFLFIRAVERNSLHETLSKRAILENALKESLQNIPSYLC